MNQKDEALAGAYHWITDLGHRAHTFGCQGSELLPEGIRRICNCGRDALLAKLKAAFEIGDFKPSNGGALL